MQLGFRWLLLAAGLFVPSALCAAESDETVDYVQDVKPILARRCYACHGALKQKNNLRLDTAVLAQKGGDGGPAVVPGKSDESLLLDAVTGANGVPKMPPEGEPLKPEEIAALKRWIESGAKAPAEKTPEDPAKHWSYQLPVRPAVPMVANSAWVRDPIDAFIAAEQASHGLEASPAAAKYLLLRRVYLDLIGLPPTRAELDAFLADNTTDAYEKVVDRLLDSPHYGERWGRHWMDVWRYSDWDGYGAEVRESQPHIWRWRDWIIESLNADKPYDQMIVEMLAGDEIAPGDPQTIRATGYLVRNWYKFSRNVWLDFTVEHTAKAFLGTTLNCARCHDHMYDPIAQQDYYRFRAIFEPHTIRTDRLPGQPDTAKDGLARVFDENAAALTFLFTRGDDKRPEKEHPLPAAVPAALTKGEFKVEPVSLAPTEYYPGLRPWVQTENMAQARVAVDAALARWTETNVTLATARQKLFDLTADNAKHPERAERPIAVLLPDALPVATEAELQTGVQQAERAATLADKTLATARAALQWTQSRIEADNANYAATGPAANAKDLSLSAGRAEREHAVRLAEQNLLAAEQKLAAARALPKPDDAATKKAIADAETAIATATKSRNEAQAALGQPLENYTRFSPVYPATSSGRRLALARWIADRNNPLTARVAINHIWLRHFGSSLVPTMFDFGLNGKPPTHPALLDWLATELMEPTTAAGAQSSILDPRSSGSAGAWRMKHIHRLIVTSNTYRQQSTTTGAAAEANRKIDPDNQYLWRMNVRRMEAEIVRDSTLHAAGRLDLTMSGPEIDENSGMTVARRSVYFRNSKEKKMTFLDLFDRPNVVECYRRPESIVPQQALAMANSPLSLAEARVLAKKLAEEIESMPSAERNTAFIVAAFTRVLNRPPTADEQSECESFLIEQAQRFGNLTSLTQFTAGTASPVPPSTDPAQRARENLVHVLLNHNDFLTVR